MKIIFSGTEILQHKPWHDKDVWCKQCDCHFVLEDHDNIQEYKEWFISICPMCHKKCKSLDLDKLTEILEALANKPQKKTLI